MMSHMIISIRADQISNSSSLFPGDKGAHARRVGRRLQCRHPQTGDAWLERAWLLDPEGYLPS